MCSSTRAAFAATRSAARGGGRTFAGAALTPAAYRSIPADGNVAAHRPLWKLIPDELLGPDVVLIHTRCDEHRTRLPDHARRPRHLSLIHISEPTRLGMISYAVFCLKKKKKTKKK